MMMLGWLILLGIFLYYTSNHVGSMSNSPRRDALDILKERYARGEISTEEYNDRKRVLEQQ